MALRPDRHIPHDGWEIRFTCPIVAQEGQILVYSTPQASGAGTANDRAVATVVANPSGAVPVGVLMTEVEDIDQSKFHRNWHKTTQVINEPVPIAKKGWITTNNIHGTPTVGATAYLGSSGAFAVTPSAAGGLVANPIMGEFETKLDEEGYASIRIELPHKRA